MIGISNVSEFSGITFRFPRSSQATMLSQGTPAEPCLICNSAVFFLSLGSKNENSMEFGSRTATDTALACRIRSIFPDLLPLYVFQRIVTFEVKLPTRLSEKSSTVTSEDLPGAIETLSNFDFVQPQPLINFVSKTDSFPVFVNLKTCVLEPNCNIVPKSAGLSFTTIKPLGSSFEQQLNENTIKLPIKLNLSHRFKIDPLYDYCGT